MKSPKRRLGAPANVVNIDASTWPTVSKSDAVLARSGALKSTMTCYAAVANAFNSCVSDQNVIADANAVLATRNGPNSPMRHLTALANSANDGAYY